MGIFPAGRNQVSMQFESGTWGTATGAVLWPGQVTNIEATWVENIAEQRYLGTDTRNVDRFTPLARDVPVTLEFIPQDWRMLGFAFGSIYTHNTGSPSPPVSHHLNEANITQENGFTSGTFVPFMSFSLEELKQFNSTGLNINKQIQGCTVNSIEISASEGDFINVSTDIIAKNIIFTSGTGATLVELSSPRPYLWKDGFFALPSGTATKIDGIKSWTWRLNNNAEGKHYTGTGSRTVDAIVPTERTYELELTMDAMSQHYKTFHDRYVSGTTFNLYKEIVQNTGSNYLNMYMSGCVVMDMTDPSPAEGLNEVSVTIRPQTCNAIAADSIDLYTPW